MVRDEESDRARTAVLVATGVVVGVALLAMVLLSDLFLRRSGEQVADEIRAEAEEIEVRTAVETRRVGPATLLIWPDGLWLLHHHEEHREVLVFGLEGPPPELGEGRLRLGDTWFATADLAPVSVASAGGLRRFERQPAAEEVLRWVEALSEERRTFEDVLLGATGAESLESLRAPGG